MTASYDMSLQEKHLQGTKALRKWSTFSRNKVERSYVITRHVIAFQAKAVRSAVLLWRIRVRFRVVSRHIVNVFRIMHPQRHRETSKAFSVRSIFRAWSREFVPAAIKRRHQAAALAKLQFRNQTMYYLELWENRWSSRLHYKFNLFRSFLKLCTYAAARTSLIFDIDTKALALINREIPMKAIIFQPARKRKDVKIHAKHQVDVQLSMTSTRPGLKFVKEFLHFVYLGPRKVSSFTCSSIHQKRLFGHWYMLTVFRKKMMRKKALQRIIANRKAHLQLELMMASRSHDLLRKTFLFWLKHAGLQQEILKRITLQCIVRPALHHWKNLMNSRTVKRFTESSITGSSFYSKDVAILSAHLMDSHHKQLYLRLLKSKKVTNGSNLLANRKLKSSNFRADPRLSQNSSFNCPNRCDKEISTTMIKQKIYGYSIEDSSCGYCDERGGTTSTLYPIDGLSCDKSSMTSLSVQNLWGREVVDDCSQSTYLGHYSKKVALSTVPSEHDDSNIKK
jgi:hypothetical protein